MSQIMTLAEVRKILPELIERTRDAIDTISRGQMIIDSAIIPENEMETIEKDMMTMFALWVKWVNLHGGIVKGPWLVDFDHGMGYYCWTFGESDIYYEHDYDSGFAGRRLLDENKS